MSDLIDIIFDHYFGIIFAILFVMFSVVFCVADIRAHKLKGADLILCILSAIIFAISMSAFALAGQFGHTFIALYCFIGTITGLGLIALIHRIVHRKQRTTRLHTRSKNHK